MTRGPVWLPKSETWSRSPLPQSQWRNLGKMKDANHNMTIHDDVIKWKHFPRYWPFARGIHRSRWIPRTKASDAELWCFLCWENNHEAGDLRRYRDHNDVIVMSLTSHEALKLSLTDCLINKLSTPTKPHKLRIIGPLWWESTGDRRIPLLKAIIRKIFPCMTSQIQCPHESNIPH